MGNKYGATYGKLFLDLILLVLLALIYQKKIIHMEFRKMGGPVLCALFLLHKGLNWKRMPYHCRMAGLQAIVPPALQVTRIPGQSAQIP